MTNTIFIKKHDSARLLTDVLQYSDGSPIDLTNATVSLIWNSTRKSASIVSATTGAVSYQLTDADVAETGTIELEWEIVFNDNKELSVPTTDRISLRILADLA